MSVAAAVKSTGNKVLDELLYIMITRFEHLVEKGFLAPHFLNKMVSDPNEILKFLRQNRAVVSDQLNRRLDPSIRPSPEQLEAKGIVPMGYFTTGHEKAIAKKHRRRSTAGQDLALMIQLRPKPQQIIAKGIATKSDMQQFIDVDEHKQSVRVERKNEDDDDDDDEEQPADTQPVLAMMDYDADDLDDIDRQDDYYGIEVFRISILSTLLFKTIQEALKKSCIDTSKQEAAVLAEMSEMNEEMKQLRDTLDKYFLSPNPDISAFQKEEDMVREKFHGIQQKLLHISERQNRIHEKLKILHSVERSMIELQNVYDKQLGELRSTEEKLLKDLKEQKLRRDKASKIMLSERSHQDWALAKLTYTIDLARDAKLEQKDEEDKKFIEELDEFLNSLQAISQHQKQIVSDYDECIEGLEQTLLRIRHDMGKVRTMTFKKIYDLHKQVQIAESLDLGLPNRRLSVASATELERERRHHSVKIQRQLSTLSNQIKHVMTPQQMEKYQANLYEIIDVQIVQSDKKLKSFFCVFVQIFNQTVCDVELMYRNLNSNKQQLSVLNGITTQEHLEKITKLCHSLYGINNVLMQIEDPQHSNLSLHDKLAKCMRFIAILKRAMAKQYKVTAIATYRLNAVAIYVARKLCVNEHMMDEIEKTHDQQIPRLAEIRSKDIFTAIVCGHKIFQNANNPHKSKKNAKPKNIQQAGNLILQNVFGIRVDDDLVSPYTQ
eukprot:CAMPEP_0197031498 /NCGR_PEP_ID=MMETSP1384-20130603/10487_1 /TAXON_ID=29189 /ORGANISM="Ammonia sp." /LENGTH=718 /DNA_ID=CAMNT_0042461031 /DNA_START=210 /DNA_END=2366 /DNA_ORIENTATION=+